MNLEEVGKKIKDMRIDRGFSLSSLAQRSGISKSALFGIEEGKVNPTVNSLWSVATALGIPFGELVQEDSELQEKNLKVKLIEKNAHIEIYKISISNYFSKVTSPHAFGTTEEIFVVSGEIRVGELTHPITLRTGERASFQADVPHIYQALSPYTVIINTITYSKNTQKYFYEDRFVDTLDSENLLSLRKELQNGIEMLRVIFSFRQKKFDVSDRNLLAVSYPDNELYLTLRTRGVMSSLRKTLRRVEARDALKIVDSMYANKPVALETMADKMLYSEISLLRGEVEIYPEVLLDFSQENYAKHDQTPFERRISVGLYSVFEYFHPGYIAQGLIIASFFNKVRHQFSEKKLEILDVGSGPGQHLHVINGFIDDLSFTCIEPSKQACDYLQNIDNVVKVLPFCFEEVGSLSQQQMILSVSSSHHMGLESFLMWSYDLLYDGGYLVISDEFISPFVHKRERARNLILHHTRYMLEVMVPIENDNVLSSQELDIYKLMRHTIPYAYYLALHDQIDESSNILYDALNKIRDLKRIIEITDKTIAYYLFMILELEALVAGLDYEEECKTSSENFIALAEDTGYTLCENSCFHPTSPDSGTYFIVLQK